MSESLAKSALGLPERSEAPWLWKGMGYVLSVARDDPELLAAFDETLPQIRELIRRSYEVASLAWRRDPEAAARILDCLEEANGDPLLLHSIASEIPVWKNIDAAGREFILGHPDPAVSALEGLAWRTGVAVALEDASRNEPT